MTSLSALVINIRTNKRESKQDMEKKRTKFHLIYCKFKVILVFLKICYGQKTIWPYQLFSSS